MSDVLSFKEGALCWTDLQTTDQMGAKRFYAAVFGWETDEVPMGSGSVYSLAKRGGRDVAAVVGMPPNLSKEISSHWKVYFWVKNVDDTVALARELGGKVIMPAFDLLDLGRMAVLSDPSAAVFSIWQVKVGLGAEPIQEHGTIALPSLETSQFDNCRTFYCSLFGWKIRASPGTTHALFLDGSEKRAEMIPMPPQNAASIPSRWTVGFRVESADNAADVVESLGGKVLIGPRDIPGVGRYALLADPQHALFGVVQALRG